MTQEQLAERSRSNKPFISNLERGRTTPTLGMLIRLGEERSLVSRSKFCVSSSGVASADFARAPTFRGRPEEVFDARALFGHPNAGYQHRSRYTPSVEELARIIADSSRAGVHAGRRP